MERTGPPQKKKVALLGDGAVGKTSLIRRFVMDIFDDRYVATIGTKVTKKEMTVKGKDLLMMIWDVLGQEGYTSVQSVSLHGAHGAILVADLTRPKTLEALQNYWLPQLNRMAGRVPVVFLGNKADLEEKARMDEGDLIKAAEGQGAPAFLTSAKTGLNVESGFEAMADALLSSTAEGNSGGLPEEAVKEVKTLVDAADAIIHDFCTKYGDKETAMSIVRQQFGRADVDITSPTVKGLEAVVDLLEYVERDFRGAEEAERNRKDRLNIIKWVE